MVNEVAIGPDGSVLGATSFGLIAWNNGRGQVLTTKNGLPCDEVYTLVVNDRGTLWLYARCGIVEISNSEFQEWWSNANSILHVRTLSLSPSSLRAVTDRANRRLSLSKSSGVCFSPLIELGEH